MNIHQSTKAYERWLRRQLDGELVEKDIEKKHKKMRDGPFPFLRATYWRWAETILDLCPDLKKAPAVLAVGDIHIENFGTWRDVEGRLVWGVNDYDEAAKMPYALDLVRLAASAVLANVKGQSLQAICTHVLAGYRDGLADPQPFVLDRHHRRLRETFEQSEYERAEFWKEFDPTALGKKSKSGGKSKTAPRRFRAALERVQPDEGIALTLTPRTAGAGSLGRPRWVAWGLWRGAPVVREAKAMVPSGWIRVHRRGSHRLRCEDIATGRHRSPDPWYALYGSVLVRRLSPNNRKLEVKAKKPEPPAAKGEYGKPPAASDLVNAKMLHAMGKELAAVHLGTGHRHKVVAADFAARKHAWLATAVAAAVAFIKREQKEFAGRH